MLRRLERRLDHQPSRADILSYPLPLLAHTSTPSALVRRFKHLESKIKKTSYECHNKL
jgi:hypothetical protein